MEGSPHTLEELAELWATYWWNIAKKKFKGIGARPAVKLNKRYTATAGRAHLEEGYIDLSVYLFERNQKSFADNTIPHELAHFIAWRLHKDRGHGKAWKSVAKTLYGDNTRCHNYVTKHEANKKAKR